MPNWSSKPSAVLRRGVPMTPALLISRSRPLWVALKRSAKPRTDARLARSSSSSWTWAPGTAARSSSTAACPFSRLRQAITTLAPARASSRAVTSPSPLFAPVTMAVRPD